MTDSTILVVDADQKTEEQIVSTLEAEGYLVFASLGRNVSAGMAEKINFSLIYLMPTSNTIEGFDTCKAIHRLEKYKDVPIVLLASLKGPLDPRYTDAFGIVDYLKMPVNSEELVEKTKKVLESRGLDLQAPEEEIGAIEEEIAPVKEPAGIQNKDIFDTEKHDIADSSEPDKKNTKDIEEKNVIEEKEPEIQEEENAIKKGTDRLFGAGSPGEGHGYSEEQEILRESQGVRDMRPRPKRSGLLVPVAVAIAVIVVITAGFFSYKFFFSTEKVKAPVAVKTPIVQPQAPVVPPPQELQKQEQTIAEKAPVEEAKETPATVKEAKPAGKPVYSVQLGAFKSESSAEALAKMFKSKGYEAFTLKGTTKDKGTVYRALIGKFENRKEALKLSARIQNEEKVKTTIFTGGTK